MNDQAPAEPSEAETYRVLPVQLITVEGGVVIKRGCTELKVMGEEAGAIVSSIWVTASQNGGFRKSDVLNQFAKPDHELLEGLLDKLIVRRMIVPESSTVEPVEDTETCLDIFYWHFGSTELEAREALRKKRIAICGVNSISRRLVSSLTESGFEALTVVDFPAIRNLEMFGESPGNNGAWPGDVVDIRSYEDWTAAADTDDIDCIVAATDYANTPALHQWNQFCLKYEIPFLPVMLRRMVGFLGPLVIPGETPCYQCLIHRENSHFVSEVEFKRKSESASYLGQAVTGFHPAMGSILGDLAAMELTKFFSGVMPAKAGYLIEVNLLEPLMKTRRVLRVPRCLACARTVTRSANSLEKADFIPGGSFAPGDEESQATQRAYQERFSPT